MEEQENKVVLAIETANTKVLEIVNNALILGWDKDYCKSLVVELVKDTSRELKELGASTDLILNTQNSIYSTFMNSWLLTTSVIEKNLNIKEIGAIAQEILKVKSESIKELTSQGLIIDTNEKNALLGQGSINNLRDFMTEGYKQETGLGASQRFVDYTERIKNTLNEINQRLADETMTLTGKDGRQLSVRNLAEIETRYKLISEDLTRNGINLNDLVVASSHPDASERCSWWQGKIFIVDLEVDSRPMGQYYGIKPMQTIVGYVDGKPYYSLLQACENGFLSYNCQHRLIKYYKGIKTQERNFIEVSKQRNLTAIQRNMENTIRKYKRREVLSNKGVTLKRKNPYTDEVEEFTEREYNILMSKYWQERYSKFSSDNNLPEYRWRTRITTTERSIK